MQLQHLRTAVVGISPWHLETMVSGGERGRHKGDGGGKKQEMENKRETDTETKRRRGSGEKKITNREEWSEKGKTFVTLSCRTIG